MARVLLAIISVLALAACAEKAERHTASFTLVDVVTPMVRHVGVRPESSSVPSVIHANRS